ncbi:CASTOR/POLLUX-related putative ion channel [Devosia sp.]|uniref:CASTOR/POLLUX-related putative ion channel n=1 Tax=Devosia sp. TaxID=1871048 RepID=UPI003265B6B8
MAQRNSLGARLRYQFDKSMAAGPIALIGYLGLVSLAIIAVAGAIIVALRIAPEGGEVPGFIEASWEALMRTLDSGTMGGDAGWGFRIVMLLVTIGGIFIVSTLIGILSSGIEGKLDELRKGRSRVLEADHTVILNWSASVFDIISELVVANASRKRPRIVIMANMDKVEMEDEIAAKVEKLGNTRIICRSGDPTDLYDLSLVSPQTSRSIIVVSPATSDAEGDDPDSQVIKTVLALVNDPKRRPEPYRIAAEIRDAKNADVARVVGGNEVQLVLADDLIARIVVHSSRQSGLSAVYSELLDFDGCEIYTIEQPTLVGNTFGDAIMAYEASALMGLCLPDGTVVLNPDMAMVIEAGTKAIIIAEDDAAIKVTTANIQVDATAIRPAVVPQRVAERTLILGWNRRAPVIAYELSRYVAPGSVLTIAADTPTLDDDIANLQIASNNLSVEYGRIDTTSRDALKTLDVTAYDHILVLGYSDILPPQPTDTRTLVTLLHLRKLADAMGIHVNVVSEMIDVRNRELAEVTRTDDFVVSNKLVSLMLAQASENDKLAAIFDDLLDEEGSEIYMRPAQDYVALDTPVTFYTVAEAARQRGEVALGYARPRPGAAVGGIIVNPKKSHLLDYVAGDRLIVLARD